MQFNAKKKQTTQYTTEHKYVKVNNQWTLRSGSKTKKGGKVGGRKDICLQNGESSHAQFGLLICVGDLN